MRKNQTPGNDDAELMSWAESDAPAIRPGAKIMRGTPQTREDMRALLESAAATEEDRALVRSAGGRPSLGRKGSGKSPLWQIRAPQSLDRAMRDQAENEGRNFSEVLRDAAEAYLRAHRAG